ncbi:aminomethyl-transferring glycine dehydrogenase subunit GcvPA [Rhodospirillum centenum]|uniref:Probable glycine dehydrogenase (decarboxylating) subunit 1 n=1 Tax=Rhodospirillum centenum (strain ATCC 51521 / SW) TaxID=414684 RepID=GCSPA_RHOCS|nr:aminomethyl-transferring glycine dehydrogenase subunit GcvPA [Rhodospirillum centenum]B6IXI3.1 RecName: Full=Probable glycine dehydrogenase (decarboxylating) subunit 1; AltName: Full=Glycine cleavage system P-protein subunit 1; AltName: Full=Glycine decarboxylase subunit 1; AltName: Full=Glycine dehydrogenase (aminomethyl-transferring) subunit 1 [Rhodospirillum centenum SW]ACJ01007.1 glycine cleavage system P-protein subunit 1 [Rhodospirillum centenum SW]
MRYLPLTEADRQAMLARIGVPDVDALFRDVPQAARLTAPIDGLPLHMGELEVDRLLSGMAAKNLTAGSVPSFLGAGAYRHHVPASVDQMLLRGEFLTSYTPYQPEVAQGTLQYLFEFQTQVAEITGMEVANASMYDGATGTAEAVLMATRLTRRSKAVLSGGLHPHYREVVATTCGVLGMEVAAQAPDPTDAEDLLPLVDDATACVVVQTPSLFGHPRDLSELAAACHAKGALLIAVVTEVVSLGLLTPPGRMGADIVVCEGQSIGNPLNFGGPHVGLFATREKFVRQMPGRLCGQTADAEGKRGFVLTLSTREQHIRREKATSNICTNSGLCALAFTIHMALLGGEGFARLARLNHAKAVTLADRLAAVPGVEVLNGAFFNEFTLRLPRPAAPVVEALAQRRILAGVPVSRLYPGEAGLETLLLVAATETNTEADMDALVHGLQEVLR